MHISLDGFVAGPKGEMDWIKVDEEIFNFVHTRIIKCDTALYGRKTYQMMENYWPTAADKPTATKHDIEHAAWYGRANKIVLSNTLKTAVLNNTSLISDRLADRINEIKQGSGEEVLLFGSPTATHSLMQLNLIDGYWLFINPVILGQGIRLFANIEDNIKLHLVSTHQFSCGVTELNYTVEPK